MRLLRRPSEDLKDGEESLISTIMMAQSGKNSWV